MSDLFHERVQPETWAAVYSVMLHARQHVYQVLTKRPARMAGWLAGIDAGSHVWHGVSVEDQRAADERVPVLLEAAAQQRFLSVEPLLGPVDLQPYLETGGIGWVIVGGESGPNYRPMQIEWLEAVVDACKRAGVPVFAKQDCGRTAGKQGRIAARSWVQQWPASMLEHLGGQ